jgi:hypothetical protein
LEIVLDDKYKFSEIKEKDKEEMEKYINVNVLALNYCGLKNLTNLPKIPNLEIVIDFYIKIA